MKLGSHTICAFLFGTAFTVAATHAAAETLQTSAPKTSLLQNSAQLVSQQQSTSQKSSQQTSPQPTSTTQPTSTPPQAASNPTPAPQQTPQHRILGMMRHANHMGEGTPRRAGLGPTAEPTDLNESEMYGANIPLKQQLSPSAQEVAKDIGIFPKVDALLEAEHNFGKNNVDVLRLRSELLEIMVEASFEVRATNTRIDDEISSANELRSVMEERREKKVAKTDVVNFMNSGTVDILTSAFTSLSKSGGGGSSLTPAGGTIGIVGGALQIGTSTLAAKLNKGAHLSSPAKPNMLAPLFGYDGPDARFPPGVWTYLNDPVPNSNNTESRKNRLVRSWVHVGRLYDPNTRAGKHHIGIASGMLPQNHEITIDLLQDRALMLSDLRATVSKIDIEMLEIIRWLRRL